MRFKLDENFGARTLALFRQRRHDVETVRSEALSGCPDEKLFQICMEEARCLVTLDLDFASVLRFPPAQCSGIAVIRAPRNPSLPVLEQMVESFLAALQTSDICGRLWIIEQNRIRVHQPADDET